MAQPRRSFFLHDGNPVGAELNELHVWLTEANFQGDTGKWDDLEEHLCVVQKSEDDLVLFVALPKHLAASRDRVESFINIREGSSLCVLVIFSESTSVCPDPSLTLKVRSEEVPPEKMNRTDKRQAKNMLPYRHSKAEFGYLVVSDLGRLLCLWRRLQATQCHDLSSLLDEASREEHVLEHLETTAMTSFTSLAVTFSDSCGACGTLEDAVRMGHLTCLQHLLANGRRPESEEFSPLHLAVLKAGQRKAEVFVKMAKLLLAAKHDPGLQTSHGITPLHWAAGYGLSALVWTMLHLSGTGELTWVATTNPYNADNSEKMGRLANLQDRRGRTALYRAVMHGHEECVRWLTDMGADCNLCDANQCSPLHAALQQNPRVALVTMLLKARAEVNSADADGRLPLHLMATHRTHSHDLLEGLLPADPVTECKDRDGWTPLHEAALSGNAKLLEELLLRAHAYEQALPGALSVRDSKVPHILHVALMAKNSECVELLINATASPLETACLTWDEEHFRIQRHYTEVGLCLMNSGILALPFDRILFKTDLDAAEFQRNVGNKFRDLQRNNDRSELKVLHTREMSQEQVEIIFAEARRLGMRCISPGEYKEDGSRQPLIVYKALDSLVHSKRVLQDIELRQRVRSRLEDMDPGAECCFYDMSGFQRRLVHEVSTDLGLHSRSEGQAVRVRKVLERASKRPRVEKDEDFLEELRGNLDQLKEGDEMHLGYGLSSYRRKMLHEEVEKRGWSSKSNGSTIAVRHLAPTEHREVTKPKLGEDEVKDWVRHQLEPLKPGESHTFPASLNSFQRRIVHQVAEELGWVHESVDLEVEGKGRGKGCGKDWKGKGFKGQSKGKTSCKGERQITVWNVPSAPSASPPKSEEKSISTEVMEALKRLSEDESLAEYPFRWELESKDQARRAAIRREVHAAQGKWPFEFLVKEERQGNKLRLVLQKQGEPSHVGSPGLPNIRFDCMKAVRSHLYEFLCTSEEELEYPTCLTKMQRSVVHEVARDLQLTSATKGAHREEQVVVRKANRGNPSEPLVIHHGFVCDNCNAVPQGLRFHCRQCEDFDFCNSCHEAWSQGNLPHTEDHTFEAMQALPEVKKATRINAVQIAAGMGLENALNILLRGSDLTQLLSSRTNMGDAALHLACHRRRRQTIQDLLEAKVDCNSQNSKGRTALHIISRIPCYKSSDKDELADIMQTLLAATGDPTILEDNGDSPLHQAILHDNYKMVEALLAARVDANIQGCAGNTALHMAAHKGLTAMARELLEARADPAILNHDGNTALEHAGKKNFKAVAQVIDGSYFHTRSRKETQEVEPPQNDVEPSCGKQTEHPSCAEMVFETCQAFALRSAFIVTNSKYSQHNTKLSDLPCTTAAGHVLRDALAISGFKVTLCEDVNEDDFWKQLQELEQYLKKPTEHLVFFYFAGHGRESQNELEMLMLQGHVSFSQVRQRLLGPKVALLAVADCCRENAMDNTFRAMPAASPVAQSEVPATPKAPESRHGNFYILWAGDRGTCINDSQEDSLGQQIAASLTSLCGRSLEEVLKQASEQVTLHGVKRAELQRPWSERGIGQDVGARVLQPVFCPRCEHYRRSGGKGSQRVLPAEKFERMLRNHCESFEWCTLAALNTLEKQFLKTSDDSRWGPLSAYFCAAVRANEIPVLQYMAHLHPELLGNRGFDVFDHVSNYPAGRPSVSALRKIPVLAVAVSSSPPGSASDALFFLLQAKADINATDKEGWTAWQLASYLGKHAPLELLLHAHCEVRDMTPWSLRPLQLAAAQGHQDCLELLLEKRAVADTIPAGWKMSLMPPVTHADPKKVWYQQIILERLGKSACKKPLGGLTALHLAALSGHSDCVRTLLQGAANPNTFTEQGASPLQLCVKKWSQHKAGHAPFSKSPDFQGVFDALLEAGASDPEGSGRDTTLHSVAFHWGGVCPKEIWAVGTRLIDAGWPTNAPGSSGGTALHFAVNGRNWAMCSLLLERRADPSLKNDAGRSVWDLPILDDPGEWPNADGAKCRQSLKDLIKDLIKPAQGAEA